MKMLRGLFVLGVGYLPLALVSSSVVSSLFTDTLEPDLNDIILSFIGLVVVALVAGVVCAWIAGSANHPAIYLVLFAIGMMGLRSLILGTGIEPGWYRLVGPLAQGIGFLFGASLAPRRLERGV